MDSAVEALTRGEDIFDVWFESGSSWYAVAIQRGMLSRNAEESDDKRVVFRIGINVGDIIIDGDDIFGDGVNIAARLQEIAPPGGIAISRRVHEDVRDRLEVVSGHLTRRVEVLKVSRQIEQQTKEAIDDRQREILLREQMRQIQKELGDGDTDENAEFADAIATRFDRKRCEELISQLKKREDQLLQDLRAQTGQKVDIWAAASIVATSARPISYLPLASRPARMQAVASNAPMVEAAVPLNVRPLLVRMVPMS